MKKMEGKKKKPATWTKGNTGMNEYQKQKTCFIFQLSLTEGVPMFPGHEHSHPHPGDRVALDSNSPNEPPSVLEWAENGWESKICWASTLWRILC